MMIYSVLCSAEWSRFATAPKTEYVFSQLVVNIKLLLADSLLANGHELKLNLTHFTLPLYFFSSWSLVLSFSIFSTKGALFFYIWLATFSLQNATDLDREI